MHTSRSCNQEPEPLKKSQDFCVKEGAVSQQERSTKSLGMKSWRRRHLRLDPYQLNVYEEESSHDDAEKPVKSWALPLRVSTRANEKLIFVVHSEDGSISKFQVESESLRAQWLRAIRRLSIALVEKRLATASKGVKQDSAGGEELSRESSKSSGVHVVSSPDAHIKDRYSVRECIGSGMAGEVYRAKDRVTGETVAIKVLEKARPPNAHHDTRRTARTSEAVMFLFLLGVLTGSLQSRLSGESHEDCPSPRNDRTRN